MSSMSPSKHPVIIQLEPQEERVLELIDSFTDHLSATRSDLPKVECRVAGGWVRDKLLGLACEDVDICISTLTGHHFATLLEQYLASKTHRGSDMYKTSKIAKIVANPDQSKHLETARMTVWGMEIDFVQLRSEEYAQGSKDRIPTAVKFGTPLEDALRRDITINTLFYNVHTRTVEDYTQKGINDLLSSSPLIRTPLEPLQTFLDDPLRILRCIRFASRFNFPIDSSIPPAVLDDRVRTALRDKVSKERVGVELEKMLKGNDPLLALRLIDQLQLYDLIFCPTPGTMQISAPIPKHAASLAVVSAEILAGLQTASADQTRLSTLLLPLKDKVAAKRLWLAVATLPLRDITYSEKKKTLPLTEYTVKECIKWPTLEKIFVQRIHAASRKLAQPTPERFTANGIEKERSSIGVLLRDADVHEPVQGLEWRTSVLLSLVSELSDLYMTHAYSPAEGSPSAAFLQSSGAHELIGTYARFTQRVEELGLDTLAFEKPRLDGTEICELLQIRPGKVVTILLQRVIEWQLDHPEATKEECAEHLKGEWDSGVFAIAADQHKDKKRKG